MVPIYILGLLQRMGPMHGYKIKKLIGEQLSDFTLIKLPTIYYHLEKMTQNELISIDAKDSTSSRPEKTIYAITESGKQAFKEMLKETLSFSYRPTFSSDATFFFADTLDPADLIKSLQIYADSLKQSLEHIKQHQEETLCYIPQDSKLMASIIFKHHLAHFQSEYTWVKDTLQSLQAYGETACANESLRQMKASKTR